MWLRFNFNQSAIASDMNSKKLLTQASCLTVRRYQLITWEENPCVWTSIPNCYHHAVFQAWRWTLLCSMARLLTLPDTLHWLITVRWGAHHHTCLTFWDCIHPFTKNGVIMHLSRKSEGEDQIIKQFKRCRMHSFHCANCNCIFHNPQIILLQYCWDSALNINGNMYITGTRDKDFQELCQFIYIINHFMGEVNSGAFHSWLWVCGRNISPQCAPVFTFAQKLPQAPGKGIILWTSGDLILFFLY